MVLMEYSKNSVTSFELPLSDSLCVFASSAVFDDDDFFVDGSLVADGIFTDMLSAGVLVPPPKVHQMFISGRRGGQQDAKNFTSRLLAKTRRALPMPSILPHATMFPGD